MTTILDIANQALQLAGTRTNMSATELENQTSNEAIQINLIGPQLRDELNRMAPWDCVTKHVNLTYITSIPTTPENTPGSMPPMWQAGLPAPPWAYEYQYPVDCLRARRIFPQYTALAGSIPIYPVGTVTGATGIGWSGPALKYKIATDEFFSVTGATLVDGGTGYAVGDLLTAPQPSATFTQFYPPQAQVLMPLTYTMNVGAPATFQVTGVDSNGTITDFILVNQVYGSDTAFSASAKPLTKILSGSYFQNPSSETVGIQFAQAMTGAISHGTGAKFSFNATSFGQQRVVLCNIQNCLLLYNAVVNDPNVWDVHYQDALIHLLASRLTMQLSGDKGTANMLLQVTNTMISEARKSDGNEGLTVNDVTPDFLRVRGTWGGPNWEFTPNIAFDWGGYWSPY